MPGFLPRHPSAKPSPPPRNRLACRCGSIPVGVSPGQPYSLEIRDRAVIGRRPDCHLVITDDDLLSGAHCALVRVGDRLLLEDLGSTNGTQVNGVPIHGRHPLSDGDRIQVGRLDLRLCLPESPP